MKPQTLLFYALLLMTIALFGCKSAKKLSKEFTVANDMLPPDFGKEETTLLIVMKDRNSFDKYLKKHFKSNYNGEYEFVLPDELSKKPYTNHDKYLYAFRCEAVHETETRYSSRTNSHKTLTIKKYLFYIVNMKEREPYKSNYKSSSFGKHIEAYSLALERKRIKEQGRDEAM